MILIALGANLPSAAGAPRATLTKALDELAKRGVAIEAVSPFYASPAWPNPSDPVYVNAVARVRTDLPPAALMTLLHEIETSFGRKRSAKNAPRTLDLDLIDYRGRVEQGPPVLPHPRMRGRGFVLVPLSDVAPGWRHPISGETVETLIAALPEGVDRIARLDP